MRRRMYYNFYGQRRPETDLEYNMRRLGRALRGPATFLLMVGAMFTFVTSAMVGYHLVLAQI